VFFKTERKHEFCETKNHKCVHRNLSGEQRVKRLLCRLMKCAESKSINNVQKPLWKIVYATAAI